MKRIIFAALVGVLVSGPAAASYTSGNQVYSSCTRDKYYCMEYAAAMEREISVASGNEPLFPG